MASCPKCGFEYIPEVGCKTCGFKEGVAAEAKAEQAASVSPSRKTLWVTLGVGILLVAVAVGVYVGVSSKKEVTPSQTPAATGEGAAKAAAQPSPQGATGTSPVAQTGAGQNNPAPNAPGAAGQASGQAAGKAPSAGAPQASAQGGPSAPAQRTPLVPAFDITQRKELVPTESYEKYLQWMLKNTKQTEPFLKAKWERSREILARPDITEERVLQAFLMTPREEFCRPYNRKNAYADAAMPIGYGQTISGPHMVSRMTQNLRVEPHHRVLEIGTGSGYQAAVLAELSNFVFTIEIVPELAKETDEIYKKLEADYPQYKNIKRKNADGYYGWEEYAPFDRIIVTAGIDHIPPPLLQQLSPGGIMVIPVGPPSGQTVMKVTKNVAPDGSVTLEREDIFHGRRKVIFVPFTSEKGGVHSLERDIQKKDQK